MNYVTHHKPFGFRGIIGATSSLAKSLVTREERARLLAVLQKHEEIYSTHGGPGNPNALTRAFFTSVGPLPPSRPSELIKWAKTIVALSEQDPNFEWNFREKVAANLQTERDLFIEIFKRRIPDAFEKFFGEALSGASTFLKLTGMTRDEAEARAAVERHHLVDAVEKVESNLENAVEFLREVGIEYLD
jgi:hypothetical protein